MVRGIRSPKEFSSRFSELLGSLQLLRDSLERLRSGDGHFVLAILAQLRALCYEKRKGYTGLLLDIDARLKFGRKIWITRGISPQVEKLLVDGGGETILKIDGFPMTFACCDSRQEEVSIDELLERPLFSCLGEVYSPAEIIKHFANEMGGTHYDVNVSQPVATFLSVGLNGQSALVYFIARLADVILQYGWLLVVKYADFEVHLAAIVPKQDVSQGISVIDSRLENSPCRVSVRINPEGKVVLRIDGINGRGHQTSSDQPVAFGQPNHLVFRSWIDRDLHSNLEIYCNGVLFARSRVKVACFCPSETLFHSMWLNRAADNENAGGDLFLFSCTVSCSSADDLRSRMIWFSIFDNLVHKTDRGGVHFRKGGYAKRKLNSTDMDLLGEYRWARMQKLGDGTWQIVDKDSEEVTARQSLDQTPEADLDLSGLDRE